MYFYKDKDNYSIKLNKQVSNFSFEQVKAVLGLSRLDFRGCFTPILYLDQ